MLNNESDEFSNARTDLPVLPPSKHESAIKRYFDTFGTAWPDVARIPSIPSLFLCFSQRTGSSRLAELLASTGKLGNASGHFRHRWVIKQSKTLGFRTFGQFCEATIEENKVNGLFATKISADLLSLLTGTGLVPQVLQPNFVFLRRRDVLNQAISYVIARETNQWNSASKQSSVSPPIYNPHAIVSRIKVIEKSNEEFEKFFRTSGYRPLRIFYEDFSRDEAGTVNAITQWLGMGDSTIEVEKTRLERQSNSVNAEWRAKFLSHGPKNVAREAILARMTDQQNG